MDEGSKNTLGAGQSLFKAVVLDVISDPSRDPSEAASNAFGVSGDRLEKCPPNSCIVAFYGPGSQASEPTIAYPFFPPHLAVPIKPGEAVWVASPPLQKPDADDCYWMCKISATSTAEDVNFAHLFRQVSGGSPEDNKTVRTSEKAKQAAKGNTQGNTLPGFLNNAGGANVIKPLPGDQPPSAGQAPNPFQTIYSSSAAQPKTTQEPIPAFVKRPGDLVLQGSNNSVIWLGQDRGYTSEEMRGEITASDVQKPPDKHSGTIDIVTGRSRYINPDGTTKSSQAPQPTRTSVKTIFNTRDYFELDKVTETPNVAGGDLDFDVDASRIYVSMKTDGDKNFGLINEFDRMPAAIVTGSIQPVSQSAYAIVKSDEVRVIARKQLQDEYYPDFGNPEINGSIKIIKEGTKDEDLAAVILMPDGTVQISGSRIFLGRHFDDGGKDESTSGPDDAVHVQPYVRYQQLEDLLNAILDNIDAFCDTLNTHVTPGYGNPSPQILEAAATLKSEVATRKSEIETLKSERIFGE